MNIWEPGDDFEELEPDEQNKIVVTTTPLWPDCGYDGDSLPACSGAWMIGEEYAGIYFHQGQVYQIFVPRCTANQLIRTEYEGKHIGPTTCVWADGSGNAPWPDGWSSTYNPLKSLFWTPSSWSESADWTTSNYMSTWLPEPWMAYELNTYPDLLLVNPDGITRNDTYLGLPGDINGSRMYVDNPFLPGGRISMNYSAWSEHPGAMVKTWQVLTEFVCIGARPGMTIDIIPLLVGTGIVGGMLFGGMVQHIAAAAAASNANREKRKEVVNASTT